MEAEDLAGTAAQLPGTGANVKKAADLVLCDGDATADVELLCNSDNIRLVVQAGRIVKQMGEP